MTQQLMMEKEKQQLTEKQERVLKKLITLFGQKLNGNFNREEIEETLDEVQKRLEFLYVNEIITEEDVRTISIEFSNVINAMYGKYGVTYENENFSKCGVFAIAKYFSFIRRYNAAMKTVRLLLHFSKSNKSEKIANKLQFELEQILADDMAKCDIYTSREFAPTDFEAVRCIFRYVNSCQDKAYKKALELLYATDVFMNDEDVAVETYQHDLLVFHVTVGGECDIYYCETSKARELLKDDSYSKKGNYKVKVKLLDDEWSILQ